MSRLPEECRDFFVEATEMISSNPYDPPKVDDTSLATSVKVTLGSVSSLRWLWPVGAGFALGSVLLAPFIHCHCDPSGHSLGAGAGGVLGMLIAIPMRIRRSGVQSKMILPTKTE